MAINTSIDKKQIKAGMPGNWLGTAVKRGLDIFGSLFCLILFSPVFALAAWRIKREDPGPVFFRGPRAGRNGRVFQILKFRTMTAGPESGSGTPVTAEDDPRITLLGRWLRDTKINELPQFWNVLKGEMSLVGPRPEDPEIAAGWPAGVREEILSVRPGITSPASVVYRHEEKMLSGGNFMDEYLHRILPDKLRLDLLYVRTRTFLLDLDILMWTFAMLFVPVKGRTVSESWLFVGPITVFIRRYLSWLVIDTLVAFCAIGLAGLLQRLSGPLNLGILKDLGLAVVCGLTFSLFNFILGLGRISWKTARPAYAFDLAFSSVLTTGVLLVVNRVWPGGPLLPYGMIVDAGIFAFFGFLVVRYRRRLLTGLASRWLSLRGGQGALGERVLIVGAGYCGQLAAWLLQKSSLSTAFNIVGMVDDDLNKQDMKIDGYPVIGTTRDIPDIVRERNIGVVLYAISTIESQAQERILALCSGLPARLVVIPDLLQGLKEQLFPQDEKEKHDGAVG